MAGLLAETCYNITIKIHNKIEVHKLVVNTFVHILFSLIGTADSLLAEVITLYRCYLTRIPWDEILLEELEGPQLFKKYP
jgi:hypothetical protein